MLILMDLLYAAWVWLLIGAIVYVFLDARVAPEYREELESYGWMITFLGPIIGLRVLYVYLRGR